jgi:hypothetical protein
MRFTRIVLASALSAGLAACGASISDLNARPAKHYQQKVDFRGEIVRLQGLTHETLLEIADTHGSRILVRAAEAVEAKSGDWVRVRGILVPEARVGDVILYDVVLADRITRARAPRLRNLF